MQAPLDDLAEELTRRLSIPFHATSRGKVAFRDKLRVTDWAVPLLFDGHIAREDEALIPKDFVGHVLWPALKATRITPTSRPWWNCTLSPAAAQAIVDELRDDDGPALDSWVIGEDVLLEEPEPRALPAARIAA